MKKILLFVLSLSVFSACRKEDPSNAPGAANPIRFDQPEPGQKSRYIRLKGEGALGDAPYSFQYLKDTLVLEVLATADIGEGVTFREYLTPGSEVFSKPEEMQDLVGGTDVFTFKVQIKNGEFVLSETAPGTTVSRLFISGIKKFPLAPIGQPEIVIKGWQPDVQQLGDANAGQVKNHHQLGVQYPSLNLLRDYKAMTYDGPGYFHLYSAEKGMVRTGWINPWRAQAGEAWDLLPE